MSSDSMTLKEHCLLVVEVFSNLVFGLQITMVDDEELLWLAELHLLSVFLDDPLVVVTVTVFVLYDDILTLGDDNEELCPKQEMVSDGDRGTEADEDVERDSRM